MKAPLDASYVVERSIDQLVKILFLAFILALFLTHTSKSLWLNVPLALTTVAGLYWLSLQVEIRARSNGASAFYRRGRKQSEDDGAEAASYPASVPPPLSNKSDNKWREQVGSPVVEHAWETLCGSIIQEFVYDTWYSVLTPDREFPREIRRILNTAFGELAGRARRADVRKMLLGDVSALFMEQIMLYRDTRDSILAGLDHDAWRVMPLEARERALQAEMKADCNLHPALYPPSADGSATLGHYKVMRHISEGLVAFMLERHDHAKPILRSVARELLSSCVLRSLMSFFNPYTANKLILSLLREKVERQPLGVEELAAAAVAASSAEPLTKAQHDIEQRARQSAAAEDSHAASVRAAKQAQRERGAAQLQRSRSEAAPSVHSDHSLPSPRVPTSGRKERRNWSPGKRDKFKAPPSPMQPHKAPTEAASAAMQQRSNGGATAPSSVRDGSDGSDEWEDVYQVRRTAGPGGMRHARSASTSRADIPSSAFGQEGEGDWLGAGDVGRREADGAAAGAAVFADSNFTPDPDIPEGPQAPGTERYCFIGQPLARVVAAELRTEGSKDVVIYKIRVADASGEWTVSRRFRNFETLHRALREMAAYRLRLPAKKIFSQQHSVEFVEDRRQQLDSYLQALLANPIVAGCKEVWEFLSRWSELYALDSEGGFLRSVSAKIQGANTTMRRAVGDMVEEMDMTRRKSMARLRNRGDAPDVPVDGHPIHRASRSFSRDLGKLRHLGAGKRGNGAGQDVATQPPPFQAMHAPGSAGSNGSGSVRMLRISGPSDLINGAGQLLAAGARQVQGVRQVLQGTEERAEARHLPTSVSMPAPSMCVGDIPIEEFHGELLHYSRPASLQSQATTPNETPLSATPASSRGHSPTRQAAEQQRWGTARGDQVQRQTEAMPPHAEQLHHSGSAGDLASSVKVTRFRQESMQKANSLESPDSLEQQPDEAALSRSAPSTGNAPAPPQPRRPPQRGDTGHISFGGIVQSPSVASVAANIEAVGPPTGMRVPDLMRDDLDMADWEEAAGISAPLYDIVDTLFELQSRGFFRRQVFGVARQVLSLVAGGAIDEWLLSNMRALRQEHTLARLLCHLQRQLWPGGAWFQSLPENQHPAGKPAQRWQMTAENFMAAHGEPPIDEDEIREAVWELLFARAPPALVRVVGKQVYHSGMADLFEMLQSRTFMQQLGYGLLKIGLINLFPELKLLFRKIERGALDTAGGHPSPPGGAAAANSGSEHAAPTSSSKSLKEPRKH